MCKSVYFFDSTSLKLIDSESWVFGVSSLASGRGRLLFGETEGICDTEPGNSLRSPTVFITIYEKDRYVKILW